MVLILSISIVGCGEYEEDPGDFYELISVTQDDKVSSSASGFLVWFTYNSESEPIYNFYMKDAEGAVRAMKMAIEDS